MNIISFPFDRPLGREEKGGENIRVEKDEIPATLFSTPQEE